MGRMTLFSEVSFALKKKKFCKSFPPISFKKFSQQIGLAQYIWPSPNLHPSSSLIISEILFAGHAQHSFCMAFWGFVETTASKSLFLTVFYSYCNIFPVPTSFTCRAFPSNCDLCCTLAQHFQLWDFALPHSKRSVPTFLSYNQCAGISPIFIWQPNYLLTWAGTHCSQICTVFRTQPFMRAPLISPLTLFLQPSVKLILEHYSLSYSVTDPLCHIPYAP